ncbi:hypothetical protein [Marinobacterium stanieri]|uniref:hypothetical protein n=1 Tax=Marinobacterium stanieri TaxID=49186 RepID=UPI000255A16C|nr:hypothetical protein [Marinobacterium stanieri]
MSYTAPAGNAVDFDFTESGYLAPAGYAVNFDFYNVPPHETTVTVTLDAPTATVLAEHDDPSGVPIISAVVEATLDAPTAAVQAEYIRVHAASITATLEPPTAQVLADYQNGRVATVTATLDAPTAEVLAVRGQVGSVSAIMDAPTAVIDAAWGAEVPRANLVDSTSAGNQGGLRWGRAAAADRSITAPSDAMQLIEPETHTHWGAGEHTDAGADIPHNQMIVLDDGARVPYGTHMPKDRSNCQGYIVPPANDTGGEIPWDRFSTRPEITPVHGYSHPPAKDAIKDQRWWHVDYWANKRPRWDTRDYTPPPNNSVDFDFTESGYSPNPLALDFEWGEASPHADQPSMPTDSGTKVPHNLPPAVDVGNRQPWGSGSWTRPVPDYDWEPGWDNDPTEDPAERPQQPIIREVYLFMPSITLYRLPDGAEIEATNVTWSTDSDSWGWRFNATLKHEQHLALVKPTPNGYTEIGCEINGHQFTALVEGYGRSRQIGNTGYTINGRSRTAWLTDPHAPARSKVITAPYSAAALAGQELANTGFTLEWNATDWLIPGGAYSYENLSPISAIKRLAEAAGYMLQSHPSDKTLIVRPRYRVSPHKWTDPTTALDAILPADLITQDTNSFISRPAYNRAIFAGGAEGGVIVSVTLDGTAGDILAPMGTDNLITHKDAGYERCRNLIATGGTWEDVTLTTMLTQQSEAPGLILPGHLVELQDVAETYPVRIDGTTITATSSETEIKIRQQLVAQRRVA